eukprot:355359-Chlamydomonas_euryale.AAC.21
MRMCNPNPHTHASPHPSPAPPTIHTHLAAHLQQSSERLQALCNGAREAVLPAALGDQHAVDGR